ncbi:MAG: serine/threonine-protein kinase [Planctomycetota bacterium]
MSDTNRTGGSDAREPGRTTRPTSNASSPNVSQPADVSLEARASARRFLERLAARTPETERYEDHGEIARGGMGSIRRVQDHVLRRTLAMKVLLEREDDDDPDAASSAEILLARFLEEAQVTGQLDHPGVVPVHDMGVDEKGRVWFTMRLVKGRNFEEIIELVQKGEEGWTRTRAVQSLHRVCEAMAFAHSKGVVHRDLKPANVMVGRFGETYVMDWGLARVADRPETVEVRVTPHAEDSSTVLRARDVDAASTSASPQLTMAGSIVGTPAYMAPEQARGAIEEVDERSDVYAVGSMLYHLLAGHRPYVPPGTKRNAIEVLRALQAGPPERIVARDVPPELVAICEKAMAREKRDRYADMLALGDDLQAYLEGRVVRAHKTGARAEFVKWVARNKLAAGALAAATLVLLGGLGSIAWVTHAKNAQLAAARDAAVLQSYGASLSTANASLTLNAVDEARRRLEACDAALRGWEWSHLTLAANPIVREIALAPGSAPEAVERISWSPDGARFAVRFAKRIEVRDAPTGARVDSLTAETYALRSTAWTPDGRALAVARQDGTIQLWTPGSSAEPRRIGKHEQPVTALRFLPDGRHLLSSAGNLLSTSATPSDDHETGRVFAWDVDAGEATFVLGSGGMLVQGIEVDARGTRALSLDRDGAVRVFDLERRELVATRRFPGSFVTAAAFEGDAVLLCTSTNGVQLWDARLEQRLAGREDAETIAGLLVDWVIGPNHIACRRSDGGIRVFDRHDFSELGTLSTAAEDGTTLTFDPSGRWLAGAGKRGVISVWNPEIPRASYDLPLPDWKIAGLAFTPDGRRLVAGSTWGRVAVLDADTGETSATLRIPRGSVRGVSVSPDGARAYVVHERGLHVLRLPTLESEWTVEGRWTCGAFAGDVFVVGGEDGGLGWLDVTEKRVLATTERHAARVTALTASVDGAQVVSGAEDGSVLDWNPTTRTVRRKVRAGGEAVTALVYEPAFAAVTVADARGAMERYDLAQGRLEAKASKRDKSASDVLAAPGGARLFTCSGDGMLRVWDAPSLLEVATLAQTGGRVEHLALSADGARVACALDRGVVRILESRASDLHAADRTEWLATQRRARGLVTRLEREFGSVRAVEEHIARDASLAPELRAATRAPIDELREEARTTLRQSLRVLQQKDEGVTAYRSALQQAERVWRLDPDRPFHREVLALGAVRAGDTARALELLERGDAKGRPGALAVRALALARLGREEEAKAALEKARDAQKKAPKDRAEDLSTLFSEVDSLLRDARTR